MVAAQTCPRCGVPLSQPSLEGLCPACLLKMTLQSHTEPNAPAEESLDRTLDHAPSPAADALPSSVDTRLPQPGQRFGDYHIVRQLGCGGMGVVFEADHLPSGRRVALKVLGQALDSPETRKRFLREGRLAASINHPQSVYVFGTEEIEGSPAISMELVTGGTLQSRVKQHGPLPVAEAVDAILNIIAGLDAAQAVGVLHRDIKPANCFLDEHGSVKIGDFGLSISTTGRGDSHLTNAGAFLGTPAFSSPEQLRGDELDVRSDIYAVGVTLYYLLTGRTPFEADNMVRLLATVLERPAESPARWRPEIPRGLARVVLCCLEKQPARRYRNYEELRQALTPFGSSTPLPAPRGARFLASFVDEFIAGLPDGLFFLLLLVDALDNSLTERTWQAASWWFAIRAFAVLYYTVPEGLWGASLGKALWGLRVVGPGRTPPGLGRALVRAVLFCFVSQIPYLVHFLTTTAEQYRLALVNEDFTLTETSSWVLFLLLFSTMRLHNGYATVYDLLSGTRVVKLPRTMSRPTMRVERGPVGDIDDAAQLGPYHVLDRLGASAGQEVLVGYDTRLLRRVWIRRADVDAPPVSNQVRGLSRPGRLRWLTSQRGPQGGWDAYEAADGRPLVSLLAKPQTWERVRYWLADLSAELEAGLKDGTLPPAVGLEHVWLTSSGGAKLLDFPAPDLVLENRECDPIAVRKITDARRLLYQVARSALEGEALAAGRAQERRIERPLPLAARCYLDALRDPAGQTLQIEQLEPLLNEPATVGRAKRLATLAAPPLLALFIASVGGFFMSRAMHEVDQRWSRQHPDKPSLRHTLAALEQLDETDVHTHKALQVYLTGHFGQTIRDDKFWHDPFVAEVYPDMSKELIDAALAEVPNPTPEELKQADLLAGSIVTEVAHEESVYFILFYIGICGTMLAAWGLAELIAAIVFGDGILLAIWGLAMVNRRGQKASRLRVVWRWLLIWMGPVLAVVMLAMLGNEDTLEAMLPWEPLAWIGGSIIAGQLVLVGFVWSLIVPGRGLHDRLAGTWVVPR